MFEVFRDDYYRYTGTRKLSIPVLMRDHSLRFLFFLRLGKVGKIMRKHLGTKYGLNLGNGNNIGRGCYLGHAYGIDVNPAAKIGENCNLHKGATIGKENRGKRKGAPTIGSRVWVGINASVVGRVCVGDDVLIAPNSYVNCDVPSHSIVMGNPCIIIPRESATDFYIENCI